jgi:hypothetical protein
MALIVGAGIGGLLWRPGTNAAFNSRRQAPCGVVMLNRSVRILMAASVAGLIGFQRRRSTLSTCFGTLAVALMSGSCSPSSPTRTVPLPLTRLRPDPVGYTAFSGYGQPTTLVIRDPGAWQAAWSQINGYVNPGPPVPEIDFSSEMVILVASGSHTSSGYDVLLTSVSKTDNLVTVHALERSPAPNCGTATVITSPVDVGRMFRQDGSVVFEITPGVNTCG